MDRFAQLVFAGSVLFLAFLYGVATVHFQIFPYDVLNTAYDALAAWSEVARDQTLSVFIRSEGTAPPEPRITTIDVAALQVADEHILVTGGPYALLSRCPRFGCLAWIIDKRGEVVHSWEVDVGALWSDLPEHSGLNEHQRFEPFGLHLSESGELLVSFQSDSLAPYGIGIAKFDKDANLIWKKANFAHHWFSVAPDGRIYTPAARYVDSGYPLGETGQALTCEWSTAIQSDVILVLDENGDILREVSVLDLLAENEYVGLIANTSDPCDPVHLNFVEYVSAELARGTSLDAGDLLISARHLNLVAVLDASLTNVKWASVGRSVQQHSPRIMPDASILVFDNFGGPSEKGGSRLLRLQYGTELAQPVFPRPDTPADVDFWSVHQGHIDPHPDGRRVLVSLSLAGRVLEVDIERGEILWKMDNTHDIGAERGGTARLATAGAYYVGPPTFSREYRR